MDERDGQATSAGATGPQQPSQAEGDRETIEADLREQPGGDPTGPTQSPQPTGSDTASGRDPRQRPSQAEGEREGQ